MNHNIDQVRKLNDKLRTKLQGGTILVTAGFQAMSGIHRTAALMKLTSFNDFTPDNDPYGEHDFGSFEVAGHKLFWKIDYYDKAKQYHSPDPANPEVTERVLTLMLASEY